MLLYDAAQAEIPLRQSPIVILFRYDIANIKIVLRLPQSSRQIAEAHYKLSKVLDFSAGRLSDSITHAENALESVEARLAELRNAVSGQSKVEEEKLDSKGKGKGLRILGDDVISEMTKSQMEALRGYGTNTASSDIGWYRTPPYIKLPTRSTKAFCFLIPPLSRQGLLSPFGSFLF